MSVRENRMRTKSEEPRLEWRTIAVSDPDPHKFAKSLQGALQELSDHHFNITSQLRLGDSMVLVANRLDIEAIANAPTPFAPPGMAPPSEAVVRRRIVEQPMARKHGQTTDEILYHYKERGEQKQKHFEGLVDALRLVREHLLDSDVFLPIRIVTVSLTQFELDTFPGLLETFAEDLDTKPSPS